MADAMSFMARSRAIKLRYRRDGFLQNYYKNIQFEPNRTQCAAARKNARRESKVESSRASQMERKY